MKIKLPFVGYFGAKGQRAADLIISHFPPHEHYLDLCGGAGGILLRKPRSPIETFNDYNGEVVNYMRVLRDHPDDLTRLLLLTPWSREEFWNALEVGDDDSDLERARKFYVRVSFSRAAKQTAKPPDWRSNIMTIGTDLPYNHHQVVRSLHTVASRLADVQLENRDALDLVKSYGAHDEMLIYFDPPYVSDTRVTKSAYNNEPDLDWHKKVLSSLVQSEAMVIISGYRSDLYDDILAEFKCYTYSALTASHNEREEVLWISPTAMARNHAGVQRKLI